MIFRILALVVFCSSCTAEYNNKNNINSPFPEEKVRILVEDFIISENRRSYNRDVSMDSSYTSNIPKFDYWRFQYVGKNITNRGEQRYDFDIYVGDSVLYDYPNVRRYLLYTGVMVKNDSIVGVQTSNGENYYRVQGVPLYNKRKSGTTPQE